MIKLIKHLFKRNDSTIRDPLFYDYKPKCDCCTCDVQVQKLVLKTTFNKSDIVIELDNIDSDFLQLIEEDRTKNILQEHVKINYRKNNYNYTRFLSSFLSDIKNNVLIERIHYLYVYLSDSWVKLQHNSTLTIKGIDNPNYKYE